MNKTGRGGISMRGGINAEFPLTQEQLNDVRLQSAMNILKVVASYEGGERVAENAWNTIMNIACGDGTTERKPFDRDDVDILRAARAVSPDAVLTTGTLGKMVYGEDWMTEAAALEADAKDLHNTQEGAK